MSEFLVVALTDYINHGVAVTLAIIVSMAVSYLIVKAFSFNSEV